MWGRKKTLPDMLYLKIITFGLVTVPLPDSWAALHHPVVDYFPINAHPRVLFILNRH